MTKIELPPLPDALYMPDGSQLFDSNYGMGASACSPAIGPYIASQLTAYALLAVEQERERCAKICQSIAEGIKTGDSMRIHGGPAGPALDCAAAIRQSS